MTVCYTQSYAFIGAKRLGSLKVAEYWALRTVELAVRPAGTGLNSV
jgi:hypothetical protein